MKAIVYDRYGSPDVLRFTDVPEPTAGPGEVLVRVRAASLNFADRAAMRGTPRLGRLAFGLRRPRAHILGRDIAGTVAAVGAGVTRWTVGADVLGEMDQYGFAEYVTAKESFLVAKPASVTFEQAATLPVAATTALQAMRLARLNPGQTVLVNGASGGVGTFAVQVAKVLGGEVTAVCSTRNAELAQSIGADHVVDYTREDVTRLSDHFDVILDLVADHSLADFRRILAPQGVYISSTGAGGEVLGPAPRLLAIAIRAPFARQKLRVLAAKRNAADLEQLAELVADGQIAPVIERSYPLAETADALRHIEREHARGKVVLTV
jgi:NADPH:quinone reductase-like Zn-dependent oxidoreductase